MAAEHKAIALQWALSDSVQIRLITKPPKGFFVNSATGSNTYLDCTHKWALRYIGGIRLPPSEPMQIGLDTHDLVDQRYRKNIIPQGTDKPNILARELLLSLPEPAEWIFSENSYYIEIEHNGTSCYFVAKIDLLDFAFNVVYDHKTTGNFKWANTPEMMQIDLQAIIYSAVALILGMTSPQCQWTYVLRTGKPRKQIVKVLIDRLEEKLLRVWELGVYLTHLRYHQHNIDSYPQVLTACSMYGGCDYREKYCNISARDHIMSMWYQHERR